MILDRKGVLHVPLALMTLLFVITGLSLWALLHHWKTLTQTQLRLDRCTGEAALDLKSKIQNINSANQQIKQFRIAEVAATINPEAAEAIRVLISIEALRQESIRGEWMMKQVSWATTAGCDDFRDHSSPLPSLRWERDPPDALGQRPLHMEDFPHSFHFEIKHSPRASAAEVFQGGQDDSSSSQVKGQATGLVSGLVSNPISGSSWHARWIAPNRLFGASFY
jgi:hypothetical protein